MTSKGNRNLENMLDIILWILKWNTPVHIHVKYGYKFNIFTEIQERVEKQYNSATTMRKNYSKDYFNLISN